MNGWLFVILVLSAPHVNTFVIDVSSLQLKRVSSRLWISFDNNHNNEGEEVSLLDSSYTSVLTCNRKNNAESELQRLVVNPLIQKLEELYQDAREPNGGRFVWDPWVAPTTKDEDDDTVQYSMKRATLSSILTSQEEYEQLLETMNELGESVGLVGISPPWLSCYTSGDFQNFHTDSSHGPLAFVVGIRNQVISGGSTLLLQPNILDYWSHFATTNENLEAPSIIKTIPTIEGQCIAFDPRIPHGVSPVLTKNNDPYKSGRIVLHGWFNTPQVIYSDACNDDKKIQEIVEECLELIPTQLAQLDIGRVMGYLCLKVYIDEDGSVEKITVVCDTLVADPNDSRGVIIGYDPDDNPIYEDAPSDIRLALQDFFTTQFPSLPPTTSDNQERTILVPFLFE